MKSHINFTVTVLLGFYSINLNAQNYADKSYYLVDSLDLSTLTESDLLIVDSCLKVFHNAEHDTVKVNAIGFIVEESLDYKLWPKYNFWVYDFVLDLLSTIPLSSDVYLAKSDPIVLTLRKALSEALNNIGYFHRNQGNIPLGLEYYHKSLKIQEEIGDKIGVAISLNNIGFIYKNQGDIPKALEYFHSSLKIQEEIRDKQGIANSLNNIGQIYYNQGDVPLALGYYQKSLKIKEEIGDKHGIGNSLNNIGQIYYNQGDVPLALEYYQKSLKIKEEIGDKQGIANTLNNIGSVYSNQGDTPFALEYYYKSLKIREEIGDKQGIALSLNNIGFIHNNQGNIPLALEHYHISLKIKEELRDKNSIAYTLSNIGQIHYNQGDIPLALEYHYKSLKIREEIGHKSGIAFSLNSIGKIFEFQGDYIKALNNMNQAYILAYSIGEDEINKISARNLHKTYLLTDSLPNAKKYLSILIERRNQNLQNNFFSLPEKEKQTYFSTMEADYGLYYDFALNFQHQFENVTDTSYNIALQNKGLTLKSSTAMRQTIQNSGDTTLINEYEDWLSLKKKIAKTNETDSTYKELVNQANEMERELVKNSTVFNDFDKVKNLKWQDVQAGLKPYEAAIEFVHFKSEIVPITIGTTNPIIYAALIVKKDSKHPDMIRLCTEEDLKEILGVFQGNNLSFVNKVYGTKQKAEKALYEKIWQPLEKYLEGIKNIYYSPTGLLHKVSFAAISKDNNVFLCDNYQLYQQSSTGKVALSKNVNLDVKDEFLLIGGVQYNNENTEKEVWNYLPGTKSETENIQSILKKKKYKVNTYTDNNASEENFKKKVTESNILHIATHGFFYPDPEKVKEELKKDIDESEKDIHFRGTTNYANWSFVNNKNPLMRSGLVLANANDVWERDPLAEGEDGILTAQEVSNLDLRNTKLVVLSACETGLGDIKGSEGVYGLQRAFKMAGVEYIIMSLWQVPDKETSEFMTYFYTQLLKVKDIRLAFANTQKYMRKKYDPYYWAAFVLIE